MDIDKAKACIENHLRRIAREETTPGLYAPIRYLLDQDPKRPFALLCLAAYSLLEEDTETAAPLAAGLELFHTFLLMTDDLLLERERFAPAPAVHQKWDRNAVILTGDVMLIYSCRLVAETGKLDVHGLNRYMEVCRKILEHRSRDANADYRPLLAGLCTELAARFASAGEAVCLMFREMGEAVPADRANGFAFLDQYAFADSRKESFRAFVSEYF